MEEAYDPFELGKKVESAVSRKVKDSVLRKYYRFRGGSWYGGIATADVIGCNLRCSFCWGWRERERYEFIGEMMSPEDVVKRLLSISEKRGYERMRVSGGEPTLVFEHLVQVLDALKKASSSYIFILETNGLLLGRFPEYASLLSQYSFLHVRVSIKGCNDEDFEVLTGARRDFFRYQLQALKNLRDSNVSVHPAIMISFSKKEECERLKDLIYEIDEAFIGNIEEEIVILYPHVRELLRVKGLRPRIYTEP
ncbi:MAG: radical SAM protein [Fervidicoccaceae archaeon]